ncbi:MAG: hypothetical protein EHM64_05255 [Ignavibacteriae bacterium]|nr:MAG: hypothetical protein EHM64_05255 [Ignavibacteriota bacterium]
MIDTAQQHITTLEKRVGTDAASPLFARLAQYYLEANRAKDALRICDAGLANFPFYTTGHLVKGKALAALHMQAEARREFEFVLDFLPDNATLINLLTQVPPAEEETLTLAPQAEPPTVAAPEPKTPPLARYEIPAPVSPPEAPQTPEPSFGFGGFDQPGSEQQPEPLPSSPPAANFFEELTQSTSPSPTENAFGFGFHAPPAEPQDTFNTSPFSEFNFPQPELLIPSPAPEPTGGFDFTPPGDMNFSMVQPPTEEESFESYASRRRKELTGENTISLDDYLSNKLPASAPEPPPAPAPQSQGFITQEFVLPRTESAPLEFSLPQTESGLPDLLPPQTDSGPQEFTLPEIILPGGDTFTPGVQNKIEELTNKLQNAGKITPVINFAQKETPAASEQDTPSGMGFVTPTLAEIYAKQGWFDDAIKAYKTLVRSKPGEKERYEKRITELEELKKKSGG